MTYLFGSSVVCLYPDLTCLPVSVCVCDCQLESAREESSHQKQNGDARQHDEQLQQLTSQLAQHKQELETRRQQQQVSTDEQLQQLSGQLAQHKQELETRRQQQQVGGSTAASCVGTAYSDTTSILIHPHTQRGFNWCSMVHLSDHVNEVEREFLYRNSPFVQVSLG